MWYRGSYLALGTREAFQGSTGLGGLCFSSDNSWKMTLPMPDSSLILEISSISRWIFGSSGTCSSSSSSFSPRLLLRSRTEKNKVHISHANSKCIQRPYTTLLFSMTLPSTAKIKLNSSHWCPSECTNHPFGTGSLSQTNLGFCSHAWIIIHTQL